MCHIPKDLSGGGCAGRTLKLATYSKGLEKLVVVHLVNKIPEGSQQPHDSSYPELEESSLQNSVNDKINVIVTI
jgi:hypothetical protein